MNYARLCMHSWSQKLDPFPSLHSNWRPMTSCLPNQIWACLPASQSPRAAGKPCTQEDGTVFFNHTQAGRKAGRKQVGNPRKTKRWWWLQIPSRQQNVCGRSLRTPSDWVSSQDCCTQKVDSMAIGGMKIPDVPAASGRLRFSRQTQKGLKQHQFRRFKLKLWLSSAHRSSKLFPFSPSSIATHFMVNPTTCLSILTFLSFQTSPVSLINLSYHRSHPSLLRKYLQFSWQLTLVKIWRPLLDR